MRSSSEFPNDDGEYSSSLASILVSPQEVDSKYYLSPKAAEGILRRAGRRGKTLPEALQKALEELAALLPMEERTPLDTADTYLGDNSAHILIKNTLSRTFVKSRRAKDAYDFETWVETEVAPTLNASDNTGHVRATALIVDAMLIDGTRLDDVRVYEEPVQTLAARMGTGGNNIPLVALEVTTEPTLLRMLEGQPGVAQSIAIPIQGTIIGRAHTSGPQGRGYGDPGSPMYTLDTISAHGVAQQTINTDTKENNMTEPTIPKLVVRRLTPTECERLMGWPDNHTLYRADGKMNSDSTRYKMCGNGVASPVAEWIGRYILEAQREMDEQ
jgi:site-specific DNA-cytosine methylase